MQAPVDEAALFREMESAMRLEMMCNGRPGSPSSPGSTSSSTVAEMDVDNDYDEQIDDEGENLNHKVHYLANGDVHVCKGCACQYAELNVDHHYICGITGFVLGVEHGVETVDYVTGKKPSNNPDDNAGMPVGGSWKPRRDMFALSKQAYLSAKTMDDCALPNKVDKAVAPPAQNTTPDAPTAERPAIAERPDARPETPTQKVVDPEEAEMKTPPRPQHASAPAIAPRTPQKRGALCVDEVAPTKVVDQNKRMRINKRNVRDNEARAALVEEAASILSKLVHFERKSSSTKTKAATNVPSDPRLRDAEFLFGAALKRYIKECLATGATPTLDAVHNLGILAHNVAAEEQRKMDEMENKHPKILHSKVRQLVATLVVCLWKASCTTPYMNAAKRGTDSFRPFACGVFYALKRGVALPDSRIVVPSLPERFTNALPALRATLQNSLAKTLQSSSHRGLCTLHRCVNSVLPDKRHNSAFDEAAKVAGQLARAAQSVQ
ncbi:MAG: hypothetical protein ACKVI4_13620 [Actinomycetales bacterium]